MNVSYKNSGVNLDAAEQSTESIKNLVKSTFNPLVLNDIGLFAGFYKIDMASYPDPVLVTSIDGVGTKLKIAIKMNIHDTVGQDLVNHCVNDIMTSGADPVAFTDYIGTGLLKPEQISAIVRGMALACKENQCALIGGETAEMPGFYSKNDYDLAGSIMGLVNQQDIIDGKTIRTGDILIGIPSNGLHTNGYSLARKVLLETNKIDLQAHSDELSASWGKVLLKIHKSYKSIIQTVRKHKGLQGISHITGGGIEGNTKRLLQKNLMLHIDWEAWQIPTEFKLIQEMGNVSDEEMRRVFNLGIGLVFVVAGESVDSMMSIIADAEEKPIIIGHVK